MLTKYRVYFMRPGSTGPVNDYVEVWKATREEAKAHVIATRPYGTRIRRVQPIR